MAPIEVFIFPNLVKNNIVSCLSHRMSRSSLTSLFFAILKRTMKGWYVDEVKTESLKKLSAIEKREFQYCFQYCKKNTECILYLRLITLMEIKLLLLLTPKTMSQLPAPQILLKIFFCTCKAGCWSSCGCTKSGMTCTVACLECNSISFTNTTTISKINLVDDGDDNVCIKNENIRIQIFFTCLNIILEANTFFSLQIWLYKALSRNYFTTA